MILLNLKMAYFKLYRYYSKVSINVYIYIV